MEWEIKKLDIYDLAECWNGNRFLLALQRLVASTEKVSLEDCIAHF